MRPHTYARKYPMMFCCCSTSMQCIKHCYNNDKTSCKYENLFDYFHVFFASFLGVCDVRAECVLAQNMINNTMQRCFVAIFSPDIGLSYSHSLHSLFTYIFRFLLCERFRTWWRQQRLNQAEESTCCTMNNVAIGAQASEKMAEHGLFILALIWISTYSNFVHLSAS